jgi:hypothetical protein
MNKHLLCNGRCREIARMFPQRYDAGDRARPRIRRGQGQHTVVQPIELPSK